jgi:glycerol uptake facilitator-like aquaporin
MIWTMVFTLVYLTLTAEGSHFEKSNVILKALGFCYSLMACLFFSYGAGQCLNPAVGLTQSTYMVIYDYENRQDPNRDSVRNNCMLIYIIAPLVGGLIAAYAFHYHNENTKQRE